MSDATWNQENFDRSLLDLLDTLDRETWPRELNRRGFWITYNAMTGTPRLSAAEIDAQLNKEASASSRRLKGDILVAGPKRQVELIWVLAAKRASKKWGGRKLRKSGSHGSITQWRNLVHSQANRLLKGRATSRAFILAGWLSALPELGKGAGQAYNRGDTPSRGSPKGMAEIARPEALNVFIRNTAQSRSAEKRGKLMETKGNPALQAAFDRELSEIEQRLHNAMEPDVQRFNARQH